MPGGGGDRVLLGDPHVEAAVGKTFGERQETGRAGHPCRERDDLGPLLGERDQRIAERGGVRRAVGADRDTGFRVERADVVQPLFVVGLGRQVALTLAGDHVYDDGTTPGRRVAQRGLERGDVVPVDRPHVLETERLEEG